MHYHFILSDCAILHCEHGSKVYSGTMIVSHTREGLITTICVNELGVCEAHFEVVQDGRFVEVAQRCQVILPHQQVRVSQGW